MKRAKWFVSLLCALLCASAVPHAYAAEGKILYVNGTTESPSGGGTGRVALRVQASDTANILCRVYNTAEVVQLAPESNGFIKVRLGQTEGYMMSKFLTDNPQSIVLSNWAYASLMAMGSAQSVPVTDDSALLAVRYEAEHAASARVLALAEEWAYVQLLNSADWMPTGVSGYVRADYVTEAQNFKYGWAATEKKGGVMKLYDAPQEDAKIIGQYYEGTFMYFLYWQSVETEWRKVRVGDTVGYVMAGFTSGFPGEMPELLQMQVALSTCEARLEPSEKSEVVRQLSYGEMVYVIGYADTWLHLQFGDFSDSPRFGYLPKDALQ